MRLSRKILFWEQHIEHLHYFAHNIDKSPLEIVSAQTIIAKDSHIRMKNKKKDSSKCYIFEVCTMS